MTRRRRCLPLLALLLAAACATACLHTPARAGEGRPRLVRVTFDARITLQTLLGAGLDLADVRAGRYADVLEWPGDAATLAQLGAATRVLDEDPGVTASQRSARELASLPRPAARTVRVTGADGVKHTESYPPFGFGSLGGFWTLAEVKAKLDDMVASDTHNIVADKVDTIGTSLQGRPIWGLQIGKAVAGPDTRPVVYLSALTHAREPEGMQNLLYFVDDLLGSYTSDPVSHYLLDSRRIYICPVVNPDGYRFNQQIHDTTTSHAFGMWRKNLRDNNNDHRTAAGDGVDINRNYGFKWGIDSIGSSPTTSSDVYRGPSAFSEPETRVQRDIVVALKPIVGASYHTYSDLFVHPWGWTSAGTPDSAKFQEWSDEMTFPNGYTAGPGPRILYSVNGEFNDWTYGDTLLKPKAYTWTPEIGSPNDGFWPSPTRIEPLALEMLRSNYTLAGIAGPWVRVTSSRITEGALNAGGLAHLELRLRDIGATGVAGPGLQATLTAVDHEVECLSGAVAYPSLGSLQEANATTGASFLVAAADTVTPGRMLRFKVDITDASGLRCRDTVEVIVGTPTVLSVQAFNDMSALKVVSGPWGIAVNDSDHVSRYLSDSPGAIYPAGNTGEVWLKNAFDLSKGVHAWALMENRWQFESDFDDGLFEASLDSVNWTPLAGNATTLSAGTSSAGTGVMAFEGTRWRWHADRFDLSAFAGGPAATRVRLRLRSLSDFGLELDGLNVDSLRVLVYDPALQPAPVAVPGDAHPMRVSLAAPSPNPAGSLVRFDFATPDAGALTLEVLDIAGRRVLTHTQQVAAAANGSAAASHYAWGWDLRGDDGRRVAPGVYLARVRSRSGAAMRRLVVLP